MKNFRNFTMAFFAAAIAAMSIVSCNKGGGEEDKPIGPTDPVKYNIVLTQTDGGTIVAKVNDTEATEAEAGDRVVVTAVANEGWQFESWSVVDDKVELGNTFSATFTMPAEEITISATFTEIPPVIPEFNLYISTLVQYGTIHITVDGVTTTETTKVAVGKTVTVEVKDIHPTRTFDYWHVEDPITGSYWDELLGETKYSNPAQFVMPANETMINVILSEMGFKINSAVNNASMGKVRITTYEKDGTTEHNNVTNGETRWPVYTGRRVKISAEPEAGYRLKEWSDAVGFTPSSLVATTLEFAMPSKDLSIKANFEAIPAVPNAVMFQQPAAGGTIEVRVDGALISSGTTVLSGQTVAVKAVPADKYELKEWGGANFANKNAAETTFVMPETPVTLTATFGTATYPINFSATAGGSVAVKVGTTTIANGGRIEGGATVSVTATPNSSTFAFQKWEGATFADATAPTTTFTMPFASATILATFEDNTPVVQDYVEIAGLKWATVNVGEPGKFAASETDSGMFYQWGFATGWTGGSGVTPAPTPATAAWHSNVADWGPVAADIPDTWGTNDPCPKGWRLPVEQQSSDAGSVHEFANLIAATTATLVGNTVVITDKNDGTKKLTLPLTGEVYNLSNKPTWRQAGSNGQGVFWSNNKRMSGTNSQLQTSRYFKFDISAQFLNNWTAAYNIGSVDYRNAYPVRCVMK